MNNPAAQITASPTTTAPDPPDATIDVASVEDVADVVVTPGVRVLRVERGPDPALLVRRGDRVTRLRGEGVIDFVLALLQMSENGTVPLGTLGSVPAPQAAAIRTMLDELTKADLVLDPEVGDAVRTATPTARALWNRCGRAVSASTIDDRLSAANVLVLGRDPLAARLAATLSRSAIAVTRAADLDTIEPSDRPTDGWTAAVVVGRGEDDPLFDRWNKQALETGTPWWAVLPHDGLRATVGPFVIPGASACWRCFVLRRAANFPDRTLVDDLAGASGSSPDTLPAATPGVEQVQTGILVEQALDRFGLAELSGAATPGAVNLVEVDGSGVHVTGHRVLRVPRCPVCSPAAGRGLPQVWYHGEAVAR
ncbi:MAG: TOMM precursor leader peptide-binding protein [Desertimonas sp.]